MEFVTKLIGMASGVSLAQAAKFVIFVALLGVFWHLQGQCEDAALYKERSETLAGELEQQKEAYERLYLELENAEIALEAARLGKAAAKREKDTLVKRLEDLINANKDVKVWSRAPLPDSVADLMRE